MAFRDIRFPEAISKGSIGGPAVDDRVIENDGQQRTVIQRAERPLWQFDIAYGLRKISDGSNRLYSIQEIYRFFLAVGGDSFRFSFPIDWSSKDDPKAAIEDTDQVLVPDDATRTRYQLRKAYTYDPGAPFSPITFHRNITRPALDKGAVLLAYNGSPTTAFTLDDEGGVLPDADPGESTIVTAGFYHDYEVAFARGSGEALQIELTGEIDGARVANRIQLIEQKDTSPTRSDVPGGGAMDWGILTGDITLSLSRGRFNVFTDNVGYDIFLPDPDERGIPAGPRIFTALNRGTGVAQVKTLADSTLVKQLAENEGASFSLARDDALATTWYATS